MCPKNNKCYIKTMFIYTDEYLLCMHQSCYLDEMLCMISGCFLHDLKKKRNPLHVAAFFKLKIY